MGKKINIAFLGNQIAPGGGSASLLLMIKALDKEKYNVFVLASECANEIVKKEFKSHSQLVIVNKKIKQFVSCAGHPPNFIEYFKAKINLSLQVKIVVDFIKQNHVKILHINNAVFSHLYKKIKQQTGVIIVSHIREQVHLYKKHFLEKIIVNNIENYSNKIIAISEKEAIPFMQRHKIEVLANPFDFKTINNIQKSDIREKFDIRANTILIGMMGRFARDKGHLLFLQAVKYFYDNFEEHNDVKFVILGVNPPKPKWKLVLKRMLLMKDFRSEVINYIKNNLLTENIIILPFIKNVYPIIKELDIYVRPSLNSDPWGRDIIEAMALGRIVVATGNYEFLIENNFSGFLVNKLSGEALGKQLIEICKMKEEKNVISLNAFNRIKGKTDLGLYGKKINTLYDSILK